MAESYSVKAQLSAVDSGFSSTLKKCMGMASTFGSTLGGINFGFLSGVGSAAFGALKNSVGGLISEIDSSNASWKTFEGNMSIIEANGGKLEQSIESVKAEMQDFAQKTVYSSSDMASTYAQLAAVGTKNTASLVKAFGGLAGAAENPQQAMKSLSQQATQMAAKPKVAWEDFKIMMEQTPAGIAAVASEMGLSTQELITKVQKGKVKTQDFFNAIDKAGNSDGFQKLATEAKTVGQAMDGLKETVGNKLTPAFDVLSKVGISAVNGLADMLGGINAEDLANKVSSAVSTVERFITVLTTAFDGVGAKVGEALTAIGDALGITNGAFSETDAIYAFSTVCANVASAIKSVADFITENKAVIAEYAPIIKKVAGAFAGLLVAKTVAPGLTSVAGSLLKMAGGGIVSLAGKLFGIAGGQKALGTASAASGPSILQSAVATLALGAAVALAAVGMALLVQSAIAMASAGWPAVGALVALVAVVALLAIGAAALGPALTAGAVGFIAFGAAIALIGAGAALAGLGLQLIAGVLPQVIAFGAQAAVALAQLGAGLAVFAAGASLTGMAVIVLGAGLLVVASALLVAGAAMVLFGVGALLAAGALALISLVMPTLAQYGAQTAVAMVQLGAGLLAFGAGALAAGAGALVLGAGLLVVAAAVLVVSAAILVLSVGALLVAASLAIVAAVLPLITAHGMAGASAITALSVSMLAFAVGAGLAGAAALVLGAGLLVAAVGIAAGAVAVGLLAAAMVILAASVLVAGAGMALIGTGVAILAASGAAAAAVLTSMIIPLIAFAPAATAAGAAAAVLGVGMAAVGVAVITLGAGVLILAAGLLTLSVGALVAAAALALLATQLPTIAAYGTQGAASIVALGTSMVVFAAGAATAAIGCGALAISFAALTIAAAASAIGVGAFGLAMTASAIGVVAMSAALKLVKTNMKSIASSAKKAESSLDNMQSAVSVVESGLDALGNMAESAMNALTSAFEGAASDAKSAATKLGTGFTMALQSGLALAAPVAQSTVVIVSTTLMAGYGPAYSAGAFISMGFAQGMLSQLATIRSAAAQMAAAADEAVRAKAKIHSPSRVAEGLGEYWGEGYVGGILSNVKEAWRAAEQLVSVPQIATPRLAMAYGGELASDYNYSNSSEYTIEVPLALDGKVVAKATARYTQEELNKSETRERRKTGKV